ncbi:ROK family transcriptional regulator [Palleronia sediminis]|uniref:ROK family transcriptional regulator n=1 Tax=Palleronia sediminis TaxID=2547833 RepID=A0A4R6AEL9_9RHOB|nr:ROK family transcriptional regulator [Palleronia sediminis]
MFDHIRASGPVSRAQVAKDLGVSPGTVSTMTADLIEAGILREHAAPRDPGDVVRGRPPVGLAVCPETFVVAGIKIAARERSGILVDFAGNRLATSRQPCADRDMAAEAHVEGIAAMLDAMLAEAGRDRRDLGGVGIGLPGFVDHAAGRVFWSPVLDARDVDLAALATARLGVATRIDNDANLVALAELWFGKGRETSDFAVVTVEQGVGIGVVLGHRLFRGANGLGLELGHTKVQIDGALCRCGQRGCLEAYLADYAIAREAPAALNLGPDAALAIPELIELLSQEAAAGNEAARSVVRNARRYLATGLATVINLFDPKLLILSGGRMRYDWLDRDALAAELRHVVIDAGQGPTPLLVHEWGDLLWAHGAAALALDHLTERVVTAPREAVA